jgi:hypothetical protein
MSQLFVDNIKNRTGGAVGFPTGVVVTGVATFNNQVSIAGTLSYEDVTNIDSTGIITAKSGLQLGSAGAGGTFTSAGYGQLEGGLVVSGVTTSTSAIVGSAVTINSTGVVATGVITATSFVGSGANLTGLPAGGVEIESGGSSLGAGVTILNFQSGATVTASGAGSTITISAGVTTTSVSPTANAIHILGIGTAQHHTLTLSAGFSTITVAGGSVGDSHSVVLVQPSSGICTVGLSTFFQFPSGATPVFSEGSSKVDLISFVVKHVGVGGTQLLTSAGLNYS